MNKVIYLLVGLPGQGKSILAKTIAGEYGYVCSADDYEGYYKDGVYTWSREACEAAHKFCKEQYCACLALGVSPIVVDNTNLTEKARRFYYLNGDLNGYEVKILRLEPDPNLLNEYAARNKHNVNFSKIFQMYRTYLEDQLKTAERNYELYFGQEEVEGRTDLSLPCNRDTPTNETNLSVQATDA